MHFSIKVLVMIILVLIAFLIFLGMMTGWSGGINELTKNLLDFFNNIMPFNLNPGQ